MKKLMYLLVVATLGLSCSSSDDETPEVLSEPEAFTVGVSTQENVDYFGSLTTQLFDTNDGLSSIEIDVNLDGSNDLQFELSTNGDTDVQILNVQAINGALIARNDEVFNLLGNHTNYIQLASMGQEIAREDYQWAGNLKLFMLYRSRNQGVSAGPSFVYETGYLPLVINDRLGWVAFRANTDEPRLTINGISIHEVALLDEPIQ